MFPNRRSGAILTIVAGTLAVVVGLFVIMATLASYKTVSVERRWAASIGTKDEILERYPPVEANAAALELERLTTALGIDTAPRHDKSRWRPEKGQTILPKDLRGNMGTWRGDQLERDHRRIDPPPADVRAFLDEHEPELEAVRRHLTSGPIPKWEMHLEEMHEAPIPNLLGHINLQKLLITDALVKTHRGDHATAARDLEASWTLIQSLWDRPILITQLITIADARMIVGALRLVEDPAPVWRSRLAEHDFREAFTRALKYEGWMWTQIPTASEHAGFSGLTTRLLQSVAGPYYRFCMADVSDEWRRRLDNLDDVTAICDYDLSAREADLDIEIPSWNFIGDIVVPNLAGSIGRLARLELDLELTARLLEIDHARRTSGAWPASMPGGERSLACPRDTWLYEVGDDGSVTVAFDREINWSERFRGHRLPAAFRLDPA